MEGSLDNYKKLDIDWLFEAEWNYKQDDDDMLENLVENLKRNKQIENIIVRQVGKRWEVVNGNHRLQAMRQLGLSQVMVYDLGEISLAEAKRIAIETNETKWQASPIELAHIFKELQDEFNMGDLVSTLPYTEGEIHNYTDLIDLDEPQYDTDSDLGEINHERSVTISYNVEDEGILDEIQKILPKFKTAVMK